MSEQTVNGTDKPNKTLATALVKAQAEMPAVEKDGTNPHFRSKFVTLGNLISKVRPVLNKHGLAVTQFPARSEDGTHVLVTVLLHESGDLMRSEAPLLLTKQDPQGQGSAITYMRRYALASVLGISDQEDDDGNGASGDKEKGKAGSNGTPPGITQTEAEALLKKALDVGVDSQKLSLYLTKLGVEHGAIKGTKTAQNALQRLSPEQAMTFDGWLLEQVEEPEPADTGAPA